MPVQTYVAAFEAESEEDALARLGHEGVVIPPAPVHQDHLWLVRQVCLRGFGDAEPGVPLSAPQDEAGYVVGS